MSSLYRDAIQWRTNQILLDNTAIKMGRRDREILNGILRLNQQLANLEKAHHTLHACARFPLTFAICRIPDKGMEATIRAVLEAGILTAQAHWANNEVLARTSLAGKGAIFSRTSLNLQRKLCPVCHHYHRVLVLNPTLTTRVFLQKLPRNLQSGYLVNRETPMENYDYELIPDQKPSVGG